MQNIPFSKASIEFQLELLPTQSFTKVQESESLIYSDSTVAPPTLKKNYSSPQDPFKSGKTLLSTSPTIPVFNKKQGSTYRSRCFSCRSLSGYTQASNSMKVRSISQAKAKIGLRRGHLNCQMDSPGVKQPEIALENMGSNKWKKAGKVFWNIRRKQANEEINQGLEDLVQIKTMGLGLDVTRNKTYLQKMIQNRVATTHFLDEEGTIKRKKMMRRHI